MIAFEPFGCESVKKSDKSYQVPIKKHIKNCQKQMKKPTIRMRILDFFDNNSGEYKTSEIAAAISASLSNTSKGLKALAGTGNIQQIKNGTYAANDANTHTPASPNQHLNRIANALRSIDANKKTIDRLLNIYDSVLDNYEAWVGENVGTGTDFEQQLLFIENFKWLTAIGDKLMKRWALEHVGYDTNTRQAQEDAKAKTAEREKAALEDAPLEEQVNVIGSFDLDTKQLIDALPTLESLTEEEEEELKV